MELLLKKLSLFLQGKRLPLIACVLADTDVFTLDADALNAADLIELRIDMFQDFSRNNIIQTIKTAKGKFNKPLISTIRDIKEGGARDIPERFELYQAVMPMCDFIDVEINSENIFMQLKNIPNESVLLIGSYHNFDSTPDDNFLDSIVAKGRASGADIVKIAVTAANRDDLIRLLLLTLRHSDKGIITMSMGDEGAPSRIISPVFGSLIAYGYVNKPSAPGQLSVSQLLQTFRLIKLR